jgi:hypothetical protein
MMVMQVGASELPVILPSRASNAAHSSYIDCSDCITAGLPADGVYAGACVVDGRRLGHARHGAAGS